MNKNLQILLVVAIIVVVMYFAIKKIMEIPGDLANQTEDNINDGLSNITNDYIRTAKAKEAQSEINKIDFLNNAWAVRANKKYNKYPYEFPGWIGTDGATQLSNAIKDSNSLVPGGMFDDSERALNAIELINSAADAAEVTMAYYNSTGKNLNKGLEWLSSNAIIAARDHFKKLTSGVYLHGRELDVNNLTA